MSSSVVIAATMTTEQTEVEIEVVALAVPHEDDRLRSTDLRNNSSTPKPVLYVPPRLDQEYYQAEVSDVGSLIAPSFETTRGFLEAYRNIFEPQPVVEIHHHSANGDSERDRDHGHGQGQGQGQGWTKEQVEACPLESDSEAIEYLARHDFNLEEAVFSLHCEMGCGKEAVHFYKAKDFSQRYSVGTMFHEAKDRLLVSAHPMIGAYSAGLWTSSSTSSSSFVPSLGSSLSNISAPRNGEGAIDATNSPATSHKKKVVEREEVESAVSQLEEGAFSQSESGGEASNEGENGGHDSLVSSSSVRLKGTQERERVDKLFRGRWVRIHEIASRMLAAAPGPLQQKGQIAGNKAGLSGKGEVTGAVDVNQSNGSDPHDGPLKAKFKKTTSNGSPSSSASTVAEAQALLDEACSMQPYVNAPGEHFSETMRAVLGELMMVLLDAREWDADARDALYPGPNARGLLVNSSRASGGGRAQGALFSHVGERESVPPKAFTGITMKEFRTLLSTGAELRLRTETETHLRASLATAKKVFREIERVLTGDTSELQQGTLTASTGTGSLVKVPDQGHPEVHGQARGVTAVTGHARAPSLLHTSPAKKGTTYTAAPHITEDDDEDDDDDNANRPYRKGKLVSRGKPHIGQLSDLLLALDRMPPGLLLARNRQSCGRIPTNPATALRDLYTLSLDLKTRTETVLDRAQVAKALKPKLLLNMAAPNGSSGSGEMQPSTLPILEDYTSSAYTSVSLCLSDTRDLVDTSTAHSVIIPRVAELNALVLLAEAWQVEMRAMMPPPPVDLGPVGSRANSRAAAAAASNDSKKPMPASLRRVEQLLLEGERLPFELTKELEVLWEKRLQAKLWLEKLKKTMSVPKVGKRAHSQRSAPTHSEGDGGNEDQEPTRSLSRPLLSDMKMMVMEGECLLSSTEGGGDTVPDEGAAPVIVPRGSVSSRELSKAQSVVEVAEEWLSRVREALSFSAELHANKQANRRKQQQRKTSGTASEPSEKEEEEEDTTADALSELQDLLKESDEMPVYMEEAVLLKCQLQALEWANKAALILPLTASLPVTAVELDEQEDSKEEGEDNKGEGDAPSSSKPRPRLAEVQRLAKEIKKIRASMIYLSVEGAGQSEETGVTVVLPEETVCLAIVDNAESWLSATKRIMQGNSFNTSEILKGTLLESIRELYIEGRSIPLNLDYEMRPLKAALRDARDWMLEHRWLLSLLGIHTQGPPDTQDTTITTTVSNTIIALTASTITTTTSSSTSSSSGDSPVEMSTGPGGEGNEVTMKDEGKEDGKEGKEKEEEKEGEVVTYEELFNCVAAASHLSADFEELRAARQRLRDADSWLQDVKERCQPKGGTVAAPTSSPIVIVSAAGTRRKGKDKVAQQEEGETEKTTSRHKPSPPTLSTKEALQGLLKAGRGLGIEVTKELSMIDDTVAAIERWDAQTSSALLTLDTLHIVPVVDQYRGLIDRCAIESDASVGGKADKGTVKPPFPCMEGLGTVRVEAGSNVKEEELWVRLQSFSADIQRLRDQAAELGIGGGGSEDGSSSSSYQQVELCCSAIQWMTEARALLYFPSASSSSSGTGKVAAGQSTTDSNSTSDVKTEKGVTVTVGDAGGSSEPKKQQRKPKADPSSQPQTALPAPVTEGDNGDIAPEVPASPPSWGDCCRSSVLSLLGDAEKYFKFREKTPHAPSSSSQDEEGGKQWLSLSFGTKYSPTSLLSTSHFDALAAVASKARDKSTQETAEKSRKRKIGSTGASITPTDDPHPENGEEEGEGDVEVDTVTGSTAASQPDMEGEGEETEVAEEAVQRKKKRVSKVVDGTPSSSVAMEGNKRKRKKSTVTQEIEEDLAVSKKGTAPIADTFVKAEGSSAPKGKRAVTKDIKQEDKVPPAIMKRFAILQPLISRATSMAPRQKSGIESGVGSGVGVEEVEGSGLALPPALEALLDFWVRSLLLLNGRLEEAAQWKESAAELMVRANGGRAAVALGARHVNTDRLGWEERARELLVLGEERGLKVQGREALEMHLERIRTWIATATAFLEQHTVSCSVNSLDMQRDVSEDAYQGALTFLALGEFIRAGELLQVDRATEMAEVKAELRKGKSWLARYNRIAATVGVAAATFSKDVGAELDLLTTEARTVLRMDVREELDAISQATRRYCLCRQLYHGSMVGCDECDEWYHFQCVGLTQFQVERADKYVCIRCSLKNSFFQAANLAAQITNRWSAPEEAQKAREARRSRIAKRVSKEEKEVSKLVTIVQGASASLAALKGQLEPPPDDDAAADTLPVASETHTDSQTAQATDSASAVDGTDAFTAATSDVSATATADSIESENQGEVTKQPTATSDPPATHTPVTTLTPTQSSSSAPPAALEDISALEHQLSVSGNTLREAFERLSRSRVEEENCSKKSQLEESRIEETIEWMLAMQGVLWPENVPDRELGRPILPERPSSPCEDRSSRRDSGSPGSHSGDMQVSHEELELEEEATRSKPTGAAGNKFLFYVPIPKAPPSKGPSACSRSKDLLSYGMCNALDAARMLGILEVVDVDTTMEAFRWMAWCFRCLHVLRIPPATHTLKRLINCCKSFKLADERVVRAIGGILSRSAAWKGKARRLIFAGQAPPTPLPPTVTKKLDSGRLHALIAEGAMVPVTSALKDHLVRTWDNILNNAPPEPIASSSMPPPTEGAVAGKPKRAPKASSSMAVPGITTFALTTMTSEMIASSDDEEDEEEDDKGTEVPSDAPSSSSLPPDDLDTIQAERRAAREAVDRKNDCVYTTLSPSMWSPLPALWPPAITVRQILSTPKPNGPLSALTSSNGSSSNISSSSSSSSNNKPTPTPAPTPASAPVASLVSPNSTDT